MIRVKNYFRILHLILGRTPTLKIMKKQVNAINTNIIFLVLTIQKANTLNVELINVKFKVNAEIEHLNFSDLN